MIPFTAFAFGVGVCLILRLKRDQGRGQPSKPRTLKIMTLRAYATAAIAESGDNTGCENRVLHPILGYKNASTQSVNYRKGADCQGLILSLAVRHAARFALPALLLA